MENRWFRFPILVVETKLVETLDEEQLEKYWEDSYVEIKESNVESIRPYVDGEIIDQGKNATVLTTSSGETFVIEIPTDKLRELLGYKPEIIKNKRR